MHSRLPVGLVSFRRVGRLLFALALAAALPRVLDPLRDVACEGAYDAVARSSLHSFKAHLSYRVQEADNAGFLAAALTPEKYGLFFHVENAVLKAMNDKYFKDKEVSASVVALYEQIFIKHLMADPALRPDRVYSDYKTLRFAFHTDSPALREHLTKALESASAEFNLALKRYTALEPLYDFPGSTIRNSSRWHLAGFGATADQAGTAARFARYTVSNSWQDFGDAATRAHLNTRALAAERYRKKLYKNLYTGGESRAFTRGEDGKYVLSPAAIEILKKASGEEPDFVQTAFLRRFGLRVNEETLSDLRTYFDLVETFAPSIYEAQETLSMGLEKATEGLVAADLAGQNVRNLHAVMAALAKAADGPRDGAAVRAVEQTRVAQTAASAAFEARRAKFEMALKAAGIVGKALIFSGDDGVFYPAKAMSEPERERFLLGLRQSALESNDFRVTFLPASYLGTNHGIPVERRADFISKAESAEKALRRRLEGKGISYLQLKEMGIALDLRPSETSVRVKLWLTGKVSPELKAAVEQTLPEVLPLGFEAGSVQELEPLSGAYRLRIVPSQRFEARELYESLAA